MGASTETQPRPASASRGIDHAHGAAGAGGFVLVEDVAVHGDDVGGDLALRDHDRAVQLGVEGLGGGDVVVIEDGAQALEIEIGDDDGHGFLGVR
jgi:hypothetical protein